MDKKFKILIADDEELGRSYVATVCKSFGYDVLEASNGQEAVEMAVNDRPDVVIMDVMMPVMDGFEATSKMQEIESISHIPVIILTALDSREDKLKGIEAGAADFLSKPVDSNELALRLRNNLRIKEYNDLIANQNVILEGMVEERTAELQKAYDNLDQANKDTRESYIETIQKLIVTSEFRDKRTGWHIRNTSLYCKLLAEKLGMDDEFIDAIYYASPMHDIGKVGVPDSILLKPGPLNSEEWATMKTHSELGYNILKDSKSKYLQMGAIIAYTHHERWDGTGYPRGLKGEEIPISGRIMNLADQYDALTTVRPYKGAFDSETTYKILTEGDAKTKPEHFDKEILGVFCKHFDLFKEISKSTAK
ncbi:MAG: response regulator [Nitrospinae bacterium]|nr:response regulator [Nitrospinota bacterium]